MGEGWALPFGDKSPAPLKTRSLAHWQSMRLRKVFKGPVYLSVPRRRFATGSGSFQKRARTPRAFRRTYPRNGASSASKERGAFNGSKIFGWRFMKGAGYTVSYGFGGGVLPGLLLRLGLE